MRHTATSVVMVLLSSGLLVGFWGCPKVDDDNGEEQALREKLKDARTRAKKAQSRAQQARQRAQEAEARAKQARERARREEVSRRAADSDFSVSAVVAVSCVLALLLTVGLLIRERRRRKILARLLRLLKRKSDERNLHR